MLTIRLDQLHTMFLRLGGYLKPRAVAFLNEAFPNKCKDMGNKSVRDSVDRALEKAWQYDIEDDDDILKYLTLMYALGFEFDEDPKYPWVEEVLAMPELEPHTKMDILHERLKYHLRSTKE